MDRLVLRCSVAVVGNCKVGKTALVQTFLKNQYPKHYIMTLACDLVVSPVNIPESNTQVELFVVDTSGSELYADMRSHYWRGIGGFVLVYDPLDLDSFRACTKWLDELAKATGATVGKDRESGKRALTGALVATKSDLSEYSKVPREQAEMLAKQHGLAFFETSALDNRDVDAPFNWLAATYEDKYREKASKYAKAAREA